MKATKSHSPVSCLLIPASMCPQARTHTRTRTYTHTHAHTHARTNTCTYFVQLGTGFQYVCLPQYSYNSQREMADIEETETWRDELTHPRPHSQWGGLGDSNLVFGISQPLILTTSLKSLEPGASGPEVNSTCTHVLFGPNTVLKRGKFHIKIQISGFSLETRSGPRFRRATIG